MLDAQEKAEMIELVKHAYKALRAVYEADYAEESEAPEVWDTSMVMETWLTDHGVAVAALAATV